MGKHVHPDVLTDSDIDEDLVAVIRGTQILVPHHTNRLRQGDKALVITRGDGRGAN